jgi:hypothetical protein
MVRINMDKQARDKIGFNNNLRKIKYIKDRIATKEDFEKGIAVFYLPQDEPKNKSLPVKLGIPFFAFLNRKWLFGKRKFPIIVIQAEETINGVIIGYLDKKGNKGICGLQEIEK